MKERTMIDEVEHAAIWPEASALDRAMDVAFMDAVRRHRAANVPMVMWENGEVKHVSPFEIPLPGEDRPRPAELSVASSEVSRRRALGGD
jgi:hypothetical protein